MFLKSEDLRLTVDDEIVDHDGVLVIERIVTLSICRCRKCRDTCGSLSSRSFTVCVHCNNHHRQEVDGRYVGPYTGPRRILENLAMIEPDE